MQYGFFSGDASSIAAAFDRGQLTPACCAGTVDVSELMDDPDVWALSEIVASHMKVVPPTDHLVELIGGDGDMTHVERASREWIDLMGAPAESTLTALVARWMQSRRPRWETRARDSKRPLDEEVGATALAAKERAALELLRLLRKARATKLDVVRVLVL